MLRDKFYKIYARYLQWKLYEIEKRNLKKKLNKWRALPCLWNRSLNTYSVLTDLQIQCNTVKITAGILWKLIN